MNLSKQQKEVVQATESKVVVVAAAASGKTTILVERVKHLLSQGADPSKIVMITFTNAAAEEMATRLGRPKGMFIGTIHSYANYLLLSCGMDTSDIIQEQEFDKLISRIEKNTGCIKEVEHLLLDEAQDSNENHFRFLLDVIKPFNYMLVGDWRQSIYRFNGAEPELLLGLTESPFVTTYDLSENYRNGSRILDYAKNIIRNAGYGYSDRSIPMRVEAGRVVEVEFNGHAIAETIKRMGNYKDWFILTRTNDQIDYMCNMLRAVKVPYDTFKRADTTNADLARKMKEDTVKVLTVHTAKGLEANCVVVVGAKFFNTEEKCISYVAATRAKNLLVWARMPNKNKKNYGMNNWET